jgi:hypothetical protein
MKCLTLPAEALETSAELVTTIARNEKAEADLPPGVYRDLPFDQYHAIRAASNTALGWLARSPAHLKAYLDGAPTFVDPTSVGRAFHAYVLEGAAAFQARYARAPDAADHKGRKPWLEWVQTVADDVIPMKAPDYDAAVEMGRLVRQYPAVAFALEGVTATELTVVWIDEATGVKCKARLDAVNPSLLAIIDLKSAEDASEYAFSRSIFNYGYYRQLAFYREGARVTWPAVPYHDPIIVAHEKKPPFAAVAYRLKEDAVLAGLDEIWGTPTAEGLLQRYARCVATDEWPGYTDEFVDITLPTWAWRRVETEGVYK